MKKPHLSAPLVRYARIAAMNATLILCVFGVHIGARHFFGIDFAGRMEDPYVWSFIFAYTSLLFIYDHLIQHSLPVLIILTAVTVTGGLGAGLALNMLLTQ